MRNYTWIRIISGLAILVAIIGAGPVKAQEKPEDDGALLGPRDPQEMAAFFDAYLPAQMARYEIPGAAIAVVKDGQLFFAEGYGVADTRSQRPVVADETLFHIGSITKLFTWTAVMQLVEEGVLDLHTDVNTYLAAADFQIPAAYPEPITLHNLLTHTPGFEDRIGNLYRISRHDGVPLPQYIREQLPARVYPPGEIIAYSNYGAALAGYIIQETSGMSYEQYIETRLLEPLQMEHTSIRHPLPAPLAADEALGHLRILGDVVPIQEYFPAVPLVGMSAAVTDMANFMIAHLQAGEFEGARILQPETARMMQRQQVTPDPRLVGVTYGFVEWNRNDQRMLWHGGSTSLFQSMIILLPEHDVGLFVIYNKKSESEAGRELRQDFLDHYYPAEPDPPQPMPNHEDRVDLFTGVYRESRWAHTTVDKLAYAFARTHNIDANSDGAITLLGESYVEVSPYFFQGVTGEGHIAFRRDDEGEVTRAFYDFDPHEALIKLPWYRYPSVHITVAGICVAIFLLTLFTWPARRGDARHRPLSAEAGWIIKMLCVVNLLYPVAMFIIALTILVRRVPSLEILAPLVMMALILPLGGAVIFTLIAWRDRYWSVSERLHYTLVTLAALIFLGWLEYWNLLGAWRFF
ncbi:MAG: serine hydrolase domain-containing protein [Anaerolineales bacterium]